MSTMSRTSRDPSGRAETTDGRNCADYGLQIKSHPRKLCLRPWFDRNHAPVHKSSVRQAVSDASVLPAK